MKRRPLAWLLPAGAAALFTAFLALACLARAESGLTSWDVRVTEAFAAWRSSGWTWTFWIFTLLGDDSLVAPLTAGLVLLVGAWGRSARAAVVGGGMVAGWVAINVAKVVVGRARPPAALALIESPSSYSMPSGHALIGVMLCGLLAYVIISAGGARRAAGEAGGAGPAPRATPQGVGVGAGVVLVAAVVAVGIGLSRVYLGVHWMSDVLAGWCLGGALLAGALGVAARWERTGGPRLLRGLRPWGARSRVLLVAAVVAVIVAAATMTVWAEPLR